MACERLGQDQRSVRRRYRGGMGSSNEEPDNGWAALGLSEGEGWGWEAAKTRRVRWGAGNLKRGPCWTLKICHCTPCRCSERQGRLRGQGAMEMRGGAGLGSLPGGGQWDKDVKVLSVCGC